VSTVDLNIFLFPISHASQHEPVFLQLAGARPRTLGSNAHYTTKSAKLQDPKTCDNDFQDELVFLGMTPSPSFVRQLQGNGRAERFIRTLKENLLWARTSEAVEQLRVPLLELKHLHAAAGGGPDQHREEPCVAGLATDSPDGGPTADMTEEKDQHGIRGTLGIRATLY
jgi:hypothetical protein